MSITVILGGRATPEWRGEIGSMLSELPDGERAMVTLKNDPSANYVIRVKIGADVTYHGNEAIRFIGEYVGIVNRRLEAEEYAQRTTPAMDIERATRKANAAGAVNRTRVLVAPFADVDPYAPSFNPTGWVTPPKTYMTVPSMEAGGEHDPATSFVPRSILPLAALKWDYLDARARYGTTW